jgi:hypothetical protein
MKPCLLLVSQPIFDKDFVKACYAESQKQFSYFIRHRRYGMPNVSKILTNALFVYIPLIYKYDTHLAKYLSDLYIPRLDL